jgi:hypothetical protein
MSEATCGRTLGEERSVLRHAAIKMAQYALRLRPALAEIVAVSKYFPRRMVVL